MLRTEYCSKDDFIQFLLSDQDLLNVSNGKEEYYYLKLCNNKDPNIVGIYICQVYQYGLLSYKKEFCCIGYYILSSKVFIPFVSYSVPGNLNEIGSCTINNVSIIRKSDFGIILKEKLDQKLQKMISEKYDVYELEPDYESDYTMKDCIQQKYIETSRNDVENYIENYPLNICWKFIYDEISLYFTDEKKWLNKVFSESFSDIENKLKDFVLYKKMAYKYLEEICKNEDINYRRRLYSKIKELREQNIKNVLCTIVGTDGLEFEFKLSVNDIRPNCQIYYNSFSLSKYDKEIWKKHYGYEDILYKNFIEMKYRGKTIWKNDSNE